MASVTRRSTSSGVRYDVRYRVAHRTVTKTFRRRVDAEEHLARAGAPARAAGLVFPSPHDGGYVRDDHWRRGPWRRATAGAGLDGLRAHDLRHTAVAFWIAAGASPTEIAARAGHTSVATVLDRYGHLLPGSGDRVNDALDRLAGTATVAPDAGVIALDARDIRAMDSHGGDSHPS